MALGTNTDPYQWVEGRYKLMRGIWEAMRDFANPCSILTKSPLVLRDVDLLKQIAEVAEVSACLSVPTLEEKAWRATEPHTPHPRARLEAVAELNRQGIPTGILVAPLMPGINDDPAQVGEIVEAATEAGATYIGGNTLFLRGAVRDLMFEWLREHRPELVPRYERLYEGGAYLRRPSAGGSSSPRARRGSVPTGATPSAHATARRAAPAARGGAVARAARPTGDVVLTVMPRHTTETGASVPCWDFRCHGSAVPGRLRRSHLTLQTAKHARRAKWELVAIIPLLLATIVAYMERERFFGVDTPVRLAAALVMVALGWALARDLGRFSAPALFRRMDPATAGTVGFLIRLGVPRRGGDRRAPGGRARSAHAGGGRCHHRGGDRPGRPADPGQPHRGRRADLRRAR